MEELNKLKLVSPNALEATIVKAVKELTGVEYDCSISNISYDIFSGAKFDVHLTEHSKLFSQSNKETQE